MASPLSGVTKDSIGTSYDVALGYDNGTTIQMVGYVLQPGTQWTQATDLQDEEHIVQISVNETDRFTRYPKQSQGDWSHGERQTFFVDPQAFFRSVDMNTVAPGQLQLLPGVASISYVDNGAQVGPWRAPVASDGTHVYVGHSTDLTHNLVISSPNGINGFTVNTVFSLGDNSRVIDILGDNRFNNVGVFVALVNHGGANNGILRIDSVGAPPTTTFTQMTSEQVEVEAVPAMCSFNGNLYFATPSTTSGSAPGIDYVAFATPGTVTTWTTLPVNEGIVSSIFSTPGTIVFTTENGLNGGFDTACNQSTIWQGDGLNPPSRLGIIPGTVRGGGVVNGITYFVAALQNDFVPFGSNAVGTPTGCVIYQVDGTQVSTFDDFRTLDPQFQNGIQVNVTPACSVVGDGRFLFVSIPGIGPRAYDLNISGNPVMAYYDDPATAQYFASRLATPLDLTSGTGPSAPINVFFNATLSVTTIQQRTTTQPAGGLSGQVQLSWMDFGAPGTVKSFRSIEIEQATALPAGASITAVYQVDNQTPAAVTFVPNNQGNLIGYLPVTAKGYRIQITVQLQNKPLGPSPVVRSISVKGVLGRRWTASVACTRNQRLRNQWSVGDDPQGLRAQDKLATIINAHQLTAGQVTLFIPSPTDPTGTEQVNAVIEDYTWTASAQPGPDVQEYGAQDMEGVVQLTLVEAV